MTANGWAADVLLNTSAGSHAPNTASENDNIKEGGIL